MSLESFQDRSGNILKMIRFNEKLYPSVLKVDNLKTLADMKIRDDDVIICGYMRSGTHWTYEMVHMLVKGKAETVLKWKGREQIELTSISDLDKLPSPRVLNTHLPHSGLPREVVKVKPKIIFLMRDPRDIAVSNYNLCISSGMYKGSWADFFNLFIEGRVMYGSWFDYVKDWEMAINSGQSDILVLHYEDTHKDPLSTVRQLSDFIGRERNEELEAAIVKKCEFTRMREDKKDYTYKTKKGNDIIFRKGQVGDWKNWFTMAQSEMFKKVLKEKMRNSQIAQRYLSKL